MNCRNLLAKIWPVGHGRRGRLEKNSANPRQHRQQQQPRTGNTGREAHNGVYSTPTKPERRLDTRRTKTAPDPNIFLIFCANSSHGGKGEDLSGATGSALLRAQKKEAPLTDQLLEGGRGWEPKRLRISRYVTNTCNALICYPTKPSSWQILKRKVM